QLRLASLETAVDAKPLDRQAPVVRRVLVIKLEVGPQPGLEPPAGIQLIPGDPVDAAAEQRRHLILEGREDPLLVGEVEIERPLREAGGLHDRADGGAVVAVTLEDPPSRFEQLAAADPLPLGKRRLAGGPATD